MAANPILNFEIDRERIQYVGDGLQRPECILAEPDGTLWAADARGGVMRGQTDGAQQIVTQKRSASFAAAASEADRYLTGTLPNGLAFARDGSFLISNFGTDCLETMSREGETRLASETFGGPDLRTVYLGSLKGSRIPYFRSPVPGLPMVHWNERFAYR